MSNSAFIQEFFDNIMHGNAGYITGDNISKLNEEAMRIYNLRSTTLGQEDVAILKQILMICNVLYNRTDLTVQPVEDGFYDLLLELYKQYDSNFQVGSAVVEFKNFIENDINDPMKVAECPIIFFDSPPKDEVHQMMYEGLNPPVSIDMVDLTFKPDLSERGPISKRTHNTEHNHPDLIGTLDKAKFVFNQDAIDAGVFEDNTVSVLERDFFQKHISEGYIRPNDKIGIVCELKYDGISVEADCTDHIISARTRGDTGIGQASDLTPILEGYRFLHGDILKNQNPIGVKFEAIMTASNLEKFNKLRDRQYVNCRSAIVGLFGAGDANQYRDLITLVPLAIDRNDVPAIENRMEEILFINSLFRSHGEPLRYCYFEGTVPELLYLIKAFYDEALIARNYMNFMFDGIVVSYTDETLRKKLGRVNYINKYSIAVKFPSEVKETVFLGYTYEVGQNGNITPMIHYNPVEFNGTIHTKSSGSSLKRFNDLALKVGDYISVAYRNDVMPYVSRIECQHNRDNPNPVVQIIENCPICGSKLLVSDTGNVLYCPNQECPGRSRQRMVNMFQKMNIKGFADSAIAALNISHLYEIEGMTEKWLVDTLGQADGKSFYSIIQSILNDEWYDYMVLGALGFPGVAHKKWQTILQRVSLQDIYNMYLSSASEQDFNINLIASVEKIGTQTAACIAHEFSFFKQDIEFILRRMHLKSAEQLSDNALTVRFSGIRKPQLCELLSTLGVDISDGSVTKKTNILIVPYNGFNSTNVQKAMQYGAKIMSFEDFLPWCKDNLGIEVKEF